MAIARPTLSSQANPSSGSFCDAYALILVILEVEALMMVETETHSR